jgi:hypothetical protein
VTSTECNCKLIEDLKAERDEARALVWRAWNFKVMEDAIDCLEMDFDRAVKRWGMCNGQKDT